MKKQKRVALHSVFAWQFALVAALPLLAAALLWGALAVPAALREIERDNERMSTAIRGQLEAVLTVPQRTLQLSAQLLKAPTTPAPLQHQVLQDTLEATPAFEAVYLTDAQGITQAAGLRPSTGVHAADVRGLDFSARPFYALAREREGPVWSDTFLSPFSGRVTAALAVPAGQGMLVADMSLAGLAQELRQFAGQQDLAVIVLDAKGHVIVHPDPHLANWQENLRDLPLVRTALESKGPTRGHIELNGERWLADAALARPAGWTVLVAQPRSRLLAPLWRIGVVAGFSIAVALVLAVLAALRLARRVAERYRRLAGAAQAIVDGQSPDTDLDFGSEEAHALWERLRGLLDRLQEQEQRASDARRDLQAVLDAATEVAFIATDTHGVLRLFNRGAAKMLGWPAEAVLGHAALARFHDPQEVQARAVELRAQLGREVVGDEVFVAMARLSGYEVRDWTYLRRDGSRLLVSLAVTAVRNAQGALTGFLYIAADQTQRQRAAELELARERAEAASRTKSEFLSRVSHELRTPLNAILGFAQLMSMQGADALAPAQRERVLRIETAGWHLLKLIDDVLDLSRIESGQVTLSASAVDLQGVIAQALRLVSPQADQLQVRLQAPPDGQTQMVLADPTRLTQVLLNLLSNAIKYNRPGGDVRLVLANPDDGFAGVHVLDTGRGMDEAQRQRLFTPFDRLGLESSGIAGTGIGLVISKRLIDLMGGRIEVQSRPGEGSCFSVLLPTVDSHVADSPAPERVAVPPPPGTLGDVVYVEDNAMNAALMRDLFALRPACRLHLCESIRHGQALIEQMRPQLALVDMHLPDGNGLELLRWLRRQPGLRDIPAIVVSADATRRQQEAAFEAGATGYLTKPVNIVDALRVIDTALGAAPADQPGTVPAA
ncbi:MAG TPA: ATP-binding protein [Ideonella sp.]|uniref:hybrid sensor histidine kinase/response regulator n=1 Tax=Ideonella sp. TaxID=1929293 RepID=UPI002E318403|nr:ATP-binding protein [Ideonella sp.]HEX5682889.1 ATP-binding protein [Ideonella sp.]